MSWEVRRTIDNLPLVRFPYREQATVWCYEEGYVWTSSRTGDILDNRVYIKEVEDKGGEE